MKTGYFIVCILFGIVLEHLFRLIFIGHSVIIVPELIIFLTIVNWEDKNILIKYIYASLLYDLWVSSQFGVIFVSMLLVYLVLYFVSKISYLGDKRVRKNLIVNTITLTLFSVFLFLIYFMSSYFLSGVLLGFPDQQMNLSWGQPTLPHMIQVCIMALAVFFVLYSFYKYFTRPRSFKL